MSPTNKMTLTARLDIMSYASTALNRGLPIFEHPDCIALAALDKDFAQLVEKDKQLHEAKLAALKYEQSKWVRRVDARIADINPTSADQIIKKIRRDTPYSGF